MTFLTERRSSFTPWSAALMRMVSPQGGLPLSQEPEFDLDVRNPGKVGAQHGGFQGGAEAFAKIRGEEEAEKEDDQKALALIQEPIRRMGRVDLTSKPLMRPATSSWRSLRKMGESFWIETFDTQFDGREEVFSVLGVLLLNVFGEFAAGRLLEEFADGGEPNQADDKDPARVSEKERMPSGRRT